MKLASPGHPKRWVFSNFYKHVKIHKGKSTATSTRRDENKTIQTIDKFISCVPKKILPITSSTNKPEVMSNIVKLSSSIENQQDFHERRVIEADNSCALIVKTPNTFNAVVNTEVEVTKVESKWTKAKYQRCEREKRRRERTLLHDKLPQPLITNFFPLLDKVSKLIGENTNLRNLFIESIEDNKTLTLDKKLLDSNTLLKCLYECASKNQLNTKNNNRFDEQLKKFSVYLFIVGGRLLYETLHKNMNDALPSISTLFRFLDNTQNNVTEGCFRFEELRVFLIKRNLPPKIWISEDATRITGKIEYDAKSNK